MLLAPIWLAAGIAAALGVLALHFLARRTPRAGILPTARFLPERALRTTSPVRQPTHLLLLALRMLALIALGLAFARPIRVDARRDLARVIVVDASRSVADVRESRDSATALISAGGALVVFDSAARVVSIGVQDSVTAIETSGAVPSMSAALVAGMRAAREVAHTGDSVEIVVISPLSVEAFDEATMSLRALWPGRIRLVRVSSAAVLATGSVQTRAATDDPLSVTLAIAGVQTADDSPARLLRGIPTADDSAWAAGGARVLVSWPSDMSAANWQRRATPDTIGGVAIANVAVVAPMERVFQPPNGRAVAWWVDGEPAATEVHVGDGCIRSVAVPVTPLGDLALRESLRRFALGLLVPCGGSAAVEALPDTTISEFTGAGSLVDARSLVVRSAGIPPLTRSLLLLAVVLLVSELAIRSRGAREVSA